MSTRARCSAPRSSASPRSRLPDVSLGAAPPRHRDHRALDARVDELRARAPEEPERAIAAPGREQAESVPDARAHAGADPAGADDHAQHAQADALILAAAEPAHR